MFSPQDLKALLTSVIMWPKLSTMLRRLGRFEQATMEYTNELLPLTLGRRRKFLPIPKGAAITL